MANPVFGALVSESGSGCCWYGNSQSNRLTPWNNDPISDTSSEAIYIRDEDSGVFWTPTPMPVRELDAYRARHGQGYTEFEHNSHALEQTLLTFVPVHADSADPIRIQRLRIKNRSSRRAACPSRATPSLCWARIVKPRRCMSPATGMRTPRLYLRAMPIIGTMDGESHSRPCLPKPFPIQATAPNSWDATARLKSGRFAARVPFQSHRASGSIPARRCRRNSSSVQAKRRQ